MAIAEEICKNDYGAKASRAAKIATAVESGLLGLYMYDNGNQFCAGDGIIRIMLDKE